MYVCIYIYIYIYIYIWGGFLTLYPVAAHAGRVQLDAVGSGTRLVWTVEACFSCNIFNILFVCV